MSIISSKIPTQRKISLESITITLDLQGKGGFGQHAICRVDIEISEYMQIIIVSQRNVVDCPNTSVYCVYRCIFKNVQLLLPL